MSFEPNKIIMGALIALLVSTVGSMVGHSLVKSQHSANVYVGPVSIADTGNDQAIQSQEKKLPGPIDSLLLHANVENGKRIAAKCLQCHSLEKGGPNKIGPNLWNIVGDKIARKSDYSYSKSFLSKDGHWTYPFLNEYLFKPSQTMPGTKMSFAGIKKDEDRADLIAYLHTLCDTPRPMPTT